MQVVLEVELKPQLSYDKIFLSKNIKTRIFVSIVVRNDKLKLYRLLKESMRSFMGILEN